jgi:Uma2 family endonuclease
MRADEYLQIEDGDRRYELVDGVVVRSPSPTPRHQAVLFELIAQIGAFLKANPIGIALPEVDVRLAGDLVYRPDLVFFRAERVERGWQRIDKAPDLVVEIVSPDYRSYDRETKKSDYERFGVGEYWLIDPDRDELAFFVLEGGQYVGVRVSGERFDSRVIRGFTLDLAAVRTTFDA